MAPPFEFRSGGALAVPRSLDPTLGRAPGGDGRVVELPQLHLPWVDERLADASQLARLTCCGLIDDRPLEYGGDGHLAVADQGRKARYGADLLVVEEGIEGDEVGLHKS